MKQEHREFNLNVEKKNKKNPYLFSQILPDYRDKTISELWLV
jgi:hypothetical protein